MKDISYPYFEQLDELFGSTRAPAVLADGVGFSFSEEFGFIHVDSVFCCQFLYYMQVFVLVRFLESYRQSETGGKAALFPAAYR